MLDVASLIVPFCEIIIVLQLFTLQWFEDLLLLMLSAFSVLDKNVLGMYVFLTSLNYALDEMMLVRYPDPGLKVAPRAKKKPALLTRDRCRDGLFITFDAFESVQQGCSGYVSIPRFAG